MATIPTQAQIEAAAKALYGDHGRPPSDKAMAMAKAALTAAAEIGRGCRCLHVSRHGHQDDCELTAAAEVGEPQTSAEYHQRRGAAWDIIDQAIADYDSFMLDDDYDAQDALNNIIAKMRERRSFYITAAAEVGCGITDHIRALKDKP